MKTDYVFFQKLLVLLILIFSPFAQGCDEFGLWKHRAQEIKDSKFSISNLKSLIESNYCGLELDIYFDEQSQDFYVSHDEISSEYRSPDQWLSVINALDNINKKNLWLDWKNASFQNLSPATQALNNIFSRNRGSESAEIFIETPNVLLNEFMRGFLRKDLQILNWVSYPADIEQPLDLLRQLRAWFYVCIRKNMWMSSPDIEILGLCPANRSAAGIFIFTINNESIANEAFRRGAKVVLSDTLLPRED